MSTADQRGERLSPPAPRTSPEQRPPDLRGVSCLDEDVLPRLVRLGYTIAGAVGSCPSHSHRELEDALDEVDDITSTVRDLVVRARSEQAG